MIITSWIRSTTVAEWQMLAEIATRDSIAGIESGGDLPDAPSLPVEVDRVVNPFRFCERRAFAQDAVDLRP
jgi:hypothetical protein